MATILSRSRWTSTAKGFPRISVRQLDPEKVIRVAPHYPAAGDVTFANPTLEESAQRLRNWRNLHVNTNGWADIGYNFAIDQAGRIFDAAGRTHAAAHAVGNNFTAIGVLFIIGDNERPSAAARKAFRDLAKHLKDNHFKNLRATPVDHGNLPNNSTACAGEPVRSDISAGNLTPGSSDSGSSEASGGSYTVRSGDTLSEIAQANGVSTSALASENGIANANVIRVGQKLTIPSGGSGGSSGGSGSRKSTAQLAKEVIDGKHGTGQARRNALGSRYSAVQAEVNRQLRSSSSSGSSSGSRSSVAALATQVLDGQWGNEPERSRRLRAAGHNAASVQREVNRRLGSGGGSSSSNRKSVGQLAQEVWRGDWGNEPSRSQRLRKAGYDAQAVQREVNRRYG